MNCGEILPLSEIDDNLFSSSEAFVRPSVSIIGTHVSSRHQLNLLEGAIKCHCWNFFIYNNFKVLATSGNAFRNFTRLQKKQQEFQSYVDEYFTNLVFSHRVHFSDWYRNSKKSMMIFSSHKKDEPNESNYEDSLNVTPHRSCSLVSYNYPGYSSSYTTLLRRI